MARFIVQLIGDESVMEDASPEFVEQMVSEMNAYNEELEKAGVMTGGDGLGPSSVSKTLRYGEDGKAVVTDGPFTESKELIASYAILQADSKEKLVEWTTRFLEVLGGGECELRPIFEPTDFSEDVFPPEEAAREEATRERMKANARA